MSCSTVRLLFAFFCVLSVTACKQEPVTQTVSPAPTAKAEEKVVKEEPPPPAPPVVETFEGEPQLSLFARVGAYRPKAEESEGLGYWATFIDHVQRTSGMRPGIGRDKGAGWVMHGIAGLDSIAFFAPLAVKPGTTYHVSFDIQGEIPQGGSAGVGVQEFSKFLWISDQFTEEMCKEYQTGSYPGAQAKGKNDWKSLSFKFTTSPRAGMVHLVIFRDGAMDREKPVVFDNISIREAG